MTGKELLENLIDQMHGLINVVESEASASSDSDCYNNKLLPSDYYLKIVENHKELFDVLKKININESEYELADEIKEN